MTRYNTNRMNITQDIVHNFREEIRTIGMGSWNTSAQGSMKTLGLTKIKEHADGTKNARKRSRNGEDGNAPERRNTWNNSGNKGKDNLQNNFTNNNSRDFYQTFNSKLAKKPQVRASETNRAKSDWATKRNCEVLVRYFDNLLNCPPPTTKLEELEPLKIPEDDIPPTKEEIKKALKTLKTTRPMEKTR